VPTALHDLTSESTETVTGTRRMPAARAVFDFPRPVLDRVSAPDANRDLGMVAEVDHRVRRLRHSATPALGFAFVSLADGGRDHRLRPIRDDNADSFARRVRRGTTDRRARIARRTERGVSRWRMLRPMKPTTFP
jgi:hypothetical protein